VSIALPLSPELDKIYDAFNKRSEARRDPVQFLHSYTDPLDIERAGIIASSLAYGRVGQIIKSVSIVLGGVADIGYRDISFGKISLRFKDFKHRFTTGEEIASLIVAMQRMTERYGSLGSGFLAHYTPEDENILPALCAFVDELTSFAPCEISSLLPCPGKGSALKRLNLFMRWMVRKDEIDPGPWAGVPRSKLIVPLDTHMHRIGLAYGFTKRKQADIKAAIEITNGFRTICPEDPVRFDFGLTHSSISGTLQPVNQDENIKTL
jgi:uncharacterized protein (TIGR02757 family)